MYKLAVKEGNTNDIIYSMALIAPAAIKQAIKYNLPAVIGLTGANLKKDAILVGKWIRANVTYKIDPFTDQNIQLPSSLIRNQKGDCKSFSMLYLAIMEAAGYNGGFRFAGYRNNNYTHVYNYFLDSKENVFTFDACIKDLKENQTHTKIKDMRINYIAGAPVMITEINKPMKRTIKTKVAVKDLMRDDRYASISGIGKKKRKFFKKLGDFVKKAGNAVKTVGMAPARGSFLVLVNKNYKGLATKLNQALEKDPAKVTEFWVKLGGDTKVLQKSINNGKNKKAKGIFGISEGEAGEGSGMNVKEITEAVGAASGIIGVVLKLLKSLGIGKKDKPDPLETDKDPSGAIDPNVPAGEDFFANDPASAEAQKYAESGGSVKPKTLEATANNTGGTGFKPSPLMIGAAAAGLIGIYLLTKKKK
jgi:hypothetical protein